MEFQIPKPKELLFPAKLTDIEKKELFEEALIINYYIRVIQI